jgi:hypothetical protein
MNREHVGQYTLYLETGIWKQVYRVRLPFIPWAVCFSFGRVGQMGGAFWNMGPYDPYILIIECCLGIRYSLLLWANTACRKSKDKEEYDERDGRRWFKFDGGICCTSGP